MPQIKVPESISLKAAFAGKDSSVRLLRDSQRPASQGSRFPLSEARHCVQERGQFTPLLSFPIPAVGHREAQPVPHNPPTTDCALNTGLCLSARSEGLGESFPQHLLRHQTRQTAQPAPGSRADSCLQTPGPPAHWQQRNTFITKPEG